MRNITLVSTLALFTLGACNGDGSEKEVEGDTTATGHARYMDAETNEDGTEREASHVEPQPESDPMKVMIWVSGDGDFSVSDPQCDLGGLDSSFEGLYEGEATINKDGVYVATLASQDATFTTPSGCEIPEVSIGTLTDVVVRGELSATQENCDSYCEAKARSYAESECESSLDEASCRADAEAEYSAGCTQTCEGTTTYAIVAESSVSAGTLTALNAQSLTGAALGEIEVDLTFDRIEDSGGEEIDEME